MRIDKMYTNNYAIITLMFAAWTVITSVYINNELKLRNALIQRLQGNDLHFPGWIFLKLCSLIPCFLVGNTFFPQLTGSGGGNSSA